MALLTIIMFSSEVLLGSPPSYQAWSSVLPLEDFHSLVELTMCILSFGVCLYALNNESAIKVLWGHLLLHVGIVNAKKDQTRGGLHIFKYDNVQSSTSSGFYNTSRLCDRALLQGFYNTSRLCDRALLQKHRRNWVIWWCENPHRSWLCLFRHQKTLFPKSLFARMLVNGLCIN
jgi:hypothetical protein